MPRPEARPQRPMVPAEPVRAQPTTVPHPPQLLYNQPRDNGNGRFSQGWSHPQAKPVPPVQERNPAQAREDENKFRNWQQQRQQTASPQNHAAPEQHQPPRQQENRPKSPNQN